MVGEEAFLWMAFSAAAFLTITAALPPRPRTSPEEIGLLSRTSWPGSNKMLLFSLQISFTLVIVLDVIRGGDEKRPVFVVFDYEGPPPPTS